MKAIAIVDTSIFCEVLQIPGKNSNSEAVIKEFEKLIKAGTSFLLPMAAIYETGNHIAHLPKGSDRRRFAKKFVAQVKMAINGDSPWQVIQVPATEEIAIWLESFPDEAMREVSMGDLSIIKEWEKTVERHPSRRVFIWSLDNDLSSYDHQP